MSLPAAEHFFLDVGRGQRLAVHHRPPGGPHGVVFHVHAFAEEMNKTRRMAWLQARSLAAAGFAVLQMDLQGCGDSGGDFVDAGWASWLDDVVFGAQWVQRQHHGVPLVLWGVRAGCLLACGAGARLDQPVNALFWQPAVSGAAVLQQTLRLATAADMVRGENHAAGADLRQKLASGIAVEVAGYVLSPELTSGLERAELVPWHPQLRSAWFEVSQRAAATPSPLLSKAAQRWAQTCPEPELEVVTGPGFWQSTEIELAPALLTASTNAIQRIFSLQTA